MPKLNDTVADVAIATAIGIVMVVGGTWLFEDKPVPSSLSRMMPIHGTARCSAVQADFLSGPVEFSKSSKSIPDQLNDLCREPVPDDCETRVESVQDQGQNGREFHDYCQRVASWF